MRGSCPKRCVIRVNVLVSSLSRLRQRNRRFRCRFAGELDAEIAEESFGLRAGLGLAKSSERLKNVLGQADDRDAAATAGLLKEVIPPRHEILKFVLPEEDRIRRFRQDCACSHAR